MKPETGAIESTVRLDALTGIRIFAAMWVVLFHVRGNLDLEFESYDYIASVVSYGELGVDLFFTLSGFIIALVYGRKLSTDWNWRATIDFWWARFIRLWPAYMFVLVLVTLWHGWFVVSSQSDPVAPRDLSVGSFIRQVFMVVQWTESDSDRLTWNGPAWTVSAEVLAYLVFPLLTILATPLLVRIPTWALSFLSVGATAPLIASTLARGSLYEPWTWVLRITCCFVAGYIGYFFYERLRRSKTANRLGGVVFIAAVAAFLAVLAVAYYTGHHVAGFVAIGLMPVMIVSLALDTGPVSRFFSSRPLVLGGMISYSVYLVHMPVIEPLWYLQGKLPFLAPGTVGSQVAFALIPVVVLVAGYALWRWVEEPCRLALRRYSPARVRVVGSTPPS